MTARRCQPESLNLKFYHPENRITSQEYLFIFFEVILRLATRVQDKAVIQVNFHNVTKFKYLRP